MQHFAFDFDPHRRIMLHHNTPANARVAIQALPSEGGSKNPSGTSMMSLQTLRP